MPKKQYRIFQNIETKKARQFVDTLVREGHIDITMNPWTPKRGHYIVEWTEQSIKEVDEKCGPDCKVNCPSWAGNACTCGKDTEQPIS